MCMGMMNYRESEDNLTLITCKGCNRTWQTTESAAEQFEEQYNSLCNACRNKSKETVSLLKRKTNFDNIGNMNINELAEKLAIIEAHAVCVYVSMDGAEYTRLKSERKKQWLEWLVREAKE